MYLPKVDYQSLIASKTIMDIFENSIERYWENLLRERQTIFFGKEDSYMMAIREQDAKETIEALSGEYSKKTEVKYCPECGRLYTDDKFCLDCWTHRNPVSLIRLGDFSPNDIKKSKKGGN